MRSLADYQQLLLGLKDNRLGAVLNVGVHSKVKRVLSYAERVRQLELQDRLLRSKQRLHS